MKYIKWFKQISKGDVGSAGGKGANLGEMVQAGFPVPDGFVVTSLAYYDFLKENRLDGQIRQRLSGLDVNNSQSLQAASQEIKEKILQAEFGEKIKKEISRAYQKLAGKKNPVAVRSSATAEDLPQASFAGQQASFMNVEGADEVLQAVQTCYASLFEARAIFYREQQGFDHLKVGIAVPVQRMIRSSASGVMFTVDPLSGDRSKISIEAVYGLGDAIVSGSVTPDQYLVDKDSLKILNKVVVKQEKMMARGEKTMQTDKGGGREFRFVEVSKAHQEKQKVSDQVILQLAGLGKKIEEHYQYPQDIEWAVDLDQNKVFIVQTRPVTTLDLEAGKEKSRPFKKSPKLGFGESPAADSPTPLLSGIPASPGSASGKVSAIAGPDELNKVKKGDVLVTEMTTPDFVPAMKRAAAIVTDKGGKTSHAAIVSRELGIPCVVGTSEATRMLKSGEIVTVDGGGGKVYEGKLDTSLLKAQGSRFKEDQEKIQPRTSSFEPRTPNLKTATKLYVNLAEVERAKEVSRMDVDGVGLLRAEFMIAGIGEHPRYALDQGRGEKYSNKLHRDILEFAKAFDPRPVVYRTTDFRSNEYRNLKGGEAYEQEEENPMIGFRGVMRYLADPEVFKMELKAVQQVRRYHKNLWVMLPFVRTPTELVEAKKIMASQGLTRGGSFKIWIMVEVPSTVLVLEKFIGAGIDGVSIGSNDLTQLIYGLDRDNPKLAPAFDERGEAVMAALERVIKTCKQHGITASICGQAPSIYPELTQKLVEWGVSSVSVSPDAVQKTREVIAQTEYRLVTGH